MQWHKVGGGGGGLAPGTFLHQIAMKSMRKDLKKVDLVGRERV